MLVRLISALCLLFFTASASPAGPFIKKYAGEVVSGSYIVKLKDGISPTEFASSILGVQKPIDTFSSENSNLVLNGFMVSLNEEELNRVLKSPGVEYVEENGILYTPEIIGGLSARASAVQTNAPWNLARLSQDTPTINPPFNYTYSPIAGKGVDVYVVDTGIYVQHTEFEDRASWGVTLGGYSSTDPNGHGTFLAGIVAGKTHGVAKLANVIAVKVLSDNGSGSVSDVISGLTWVLQNANSTGRKSVVLIALGSAVSSSLDNAVLSVISSGIPVVTVAGGDNTDASGSSPARVAQAITVAASTQTDSAASFSNYGSVVDLYAPGQNIVSAWMGSTTALNTLSGVSTASAHVAGLAAYVLSLTGSITPATLTSDLIAIGAKNVLTGVPLGTPNRLANNNVTRIGITV